MSYGDAWPPPDPNDWHIESVVQIHDEFGPIVYHYLMRGDKCYEGRFTFQSITYTWRKRQ